MSHPKRHHVTPKFFLRRFADSKDRVTVINRNDHSQYTKGVAKALVERKFYDAPLPGTEDPYWLETAFSQVEGAAKRGFDRIDSGVFPPKGRDRDVLRTFVALGLIRGFRFRHVVQPAYEQWKTLPLPTRTEMSANARLLLGVEPSTEQLDAMIGDIQRAKELDESLPSGAAAGLIALISGAVSEHLAGRTWHILTFDEPVLVTGDAPVALNNDVLSRSLALGLNCDEILMPIDPRRVLFLLRKGPDGTRRKGSPELARRVNFTVASQCLRWIVHHPAAVPQLDLEELGLAGDTLVAPGYRESGASP
jgi:Protein of unknown function (DUF4238)